MSLPPSIDDGKVVQHEIVGVYLQAGISQSTGNSVCFECHVVRVGPTNHTDTGGRRVLVTDQTVMVG